MAAICISMVFHVYGEEKRFKSIQRTLKSINSTFNIQDDINVIINKHLNLIYATKIPVKIINKSGFELPKYESAGAAGFDIRAKFPTDTDEIFELSHLGAEYSQVILKPGEQYNFDTGLYIEVPEGYELDVRGRSGLAFKHGIGIVHGVGTIDSDYRGEIRVCLINHSNEDFIVKHGDRIAQGLLIPVLQAEFVEVEELSTSDRGQAGFGSTGI